MADDSDDARSGLGSMDDGEAVLFTEEASERGSPAPEAEQNEVIQNQPHDEAMEVDGSDDSSSVASPASATMGATGETAAKLVEQVENQPFDEAIDLSDDGSVQSEETGSKMSPDPQQTPTNANAALETPTRMPDSEDSSSSDSNEEDPGVEEGQTVFTGEEGGYDPTEFEDLEVSEEIRSLFGYIGRYNPHKIDLDSVLQPFLPDYVPAVGDIDAFIKLPRPDGKVDQLGITVLDEPALDLSDPAALEIQLRLASKNVNLGEAAVRTIDAAAKNPRAIKAWVSSIDEVHSKKPPPEVMYSRPMPDIESLMQVWPPQFEDELSRCTLPSKELDMPLDEYIRIIMALFDIPVHGSLTEALHVFFTLYSEFKNNDHFRNEMDAAAFAGGGVDMSAQFSPTEHGGMAGFGGPGMMEGMLDPMGEMPADPGLMIGGSMLSPAVPHGIYDREVAAMGDEINPPPVTFHERPS